MSAPVHVESVGIGPPLVLLHGFAMHGGLFAPILPALARRHRVHVVDLPGHGHSPAIEPFDLASLAAAIDAAIDPAEDRLIVLGWSLGGQVAIQWARTARARVARLVLVGTTPSFVERPAWPHAITTETLARFRDELRVAYRLTLQRFLALQVHGSEEGRATLAKLRARLFERGEPPPAALAAALGLLAATDLRATLAEVRVSALVVGGTRDALVPIEATRELAMRLPDAHHVAIDGAAHAPFLSHRASFLDAVVPFVDA